MKRKEADHGLRRELGNRQVEQSCLVAIRRPEREADPSKREWKSDRAREHDTPEDCQMHQPALRAPWPNKRLREDVRPPRPRHQQRVAAEVAPGEKLSDARAKVAVGGRSCEPERVAVDEPGDGENR